MQMATASRRTIAFVLAILACWQLRPTSALRTDRRVYTPNHHNARYDLAILSRQQACRLCNQWSNSIFEKGGTLKQEDEHLVAEINCFETYVQTQATWADVYYGYSPKCNMHGGGVLFLAVGTVEVPNLKLRLIVQSPHWSSVQINSHNLERSLRDEANCSELDLDLSEVFEKDVRYRLEWDGQWTG